jgi:ubiquitin carboxyl-terminal hydrolase 7
MLVEPADYDGDDKQEVAIIQPLQLDDEEAEQPILADDCMLLGVLLSLSSAVALTAYTTDEAMKGLVLKELPDLKTEAEAVSTWNITSWRSLKRKEMGPIFECGGQPWYAFRLLSYQLPF